MKAVVPLLVPLSLVILWVVVTSVGLIDPLFLPSPFKVAESLLAGVMDGSLLSGLGRTLLRALMGFLLASLLGIPVGLLVGRVPSLYAAVRPTVDFFRSVPATALFPLFLLIFGIGDHSKIAVVVYACSLVILVNSAYGALQTSTIRIRSAKIMGGTRFQVFRTIVLPEALPAVLAGLRTALSLALVLVVVTEMFIGTSIGIGHSIIDKQLLYQIPQMYAAICALGIAGYLLNSAVVWLEKRILHWIGK